MIRSVVFATAAVIGLARCGPGYQVEFQNQSSITYWYDPARQSMGRLQNLCPGALQPVRQGRVATGRIGERLLRQEPVVRLPDA